jgi:hypothetical protein
MIRKAAPVPQAGEEPDVQVSATELIGQVVVIARMQQEDQRHADARDGS